jgi:hypothetical protein
VAAGGLDLERPRALGDLVTAAFNLFTRHFSLVFTLAIIVVTLPGLLINGVWGGTLADAADADPPVEVFVASGLVGTFLVGPLVTAMVVCVVLALRDGREPTVGEALRAGLRIFLPAAVAIGIAALLTAAGLILVLPGIWLGVLLLFTGQAVVVDGCRGTAALRRSAEVVRGQWWSTFGRIIVISLVAAAVALIPGLLAVAIDQGALHTALIIIGDAMGAAFSAVATTLLFFDRRARRQGEVVA